MWFVVCVRARKATDARTSRTSSSLPGTLRPRHCIRSESEYCAVGWGSAAPCERGGTGANRSGEARSRRPVGGTRGCCSSHIHPIPGSLMQLPSRAHPNNGSRPNNASGRNGASGSNGKLDRTLAAGALERLSGWQLDVLVRDFARFIDSEVAMLCQLGVKGQSPVVISSWGLRTANEVILRPREGGFVGRASSLPRAAFVPIHPLLDSSWRTRGTRR